jgi:glycosyltransferase involved in cell wall biosynthesis
VTDLISVIVVTFNREDALSAVLRGLSRQSDKQFEVIIADDGSRPATAQLVESWTERLEVPLKAIRHDNRGFRAAAIRNRAILASGGSYCIFLDGDCIPRPDFIAVHRRLSEPKWFVFGNRVLLSRALSEAVLREHLEPETWSLGDFLRQELAGRINRLSPLIRLPLGPLRKVNPRQWRNVRSCNLAVWKSDLKRVDGFDAHFRGWGFEDSDLAIRLIRAGCRRKDGRFATGVLHLWHPFSDRAPLVDNQLRLNATVTSERVRALEGLSVLGGGAPETELSLRTQEPQPPVRRPRPRKPVASRGRKKSS